MTKTEFKLVLINSLFNFANILSTSFVSVFIYAYTQSLVMMSIYTIIRIGLFPFFFTIGGKLVRKYPYSLTIASGLIFLTIMMLYILLGQPLFVQNNLYVYIAAIFYGMGEGLYWFSINTCNQIAPLPDHRNTYLTNVGIFNNITGIIAPIVSSFILSYVASETIGYYGIFVLVIIFYVLITIVSVTLKIDHKETRNFSVLKCLQFSKKDTNWMMVMLSTFFYGFQNSLSLTLTNIMIYNATGGSDALYSKLLVVFAFVTIASFYLMRSKMNDNNMFKFFRIGLVFIVSSALVLVYFENVLGAIYFGFANAIGSAFYGNPYSLAMLNAIAKYDDGTENVTGRVIAKETAMSVGRCIGMLMIVVFYFVIGEAYYLQAAVTILSISPIFVYLLIKKYYRGRA